MGVADVVRRRSYSAICVIQIYVIYLFVTVCEGLGRCRLPG